MYVWQFGIMLDDIVYVILGRTWGEFVELMEDFSQRWETNEHERICVFIHNESFEFNFSFCHLFKWARVFSIETRKPIYALSENGLEFRCSYLLSGYSLESLAKNLNTWEVKKLTGDLDYSKIRHSKTPLTEQEIEYCVFDVVIVCCYIDEQIKQCGSIQEIPLTKTGFVRQFCRSKCLYTEGMSRKQAKLTKKYKDYRKLMTTLVLDVDEYKHLQNAFQGGFTHCNPWYVGKVIEDVTSYDFTSSYPFVLCSEMFPMGKGERYTIKNRDDFFFQLRNYCCLFELNLKNVSAKDVYEHYISYSHCYNVKNPVISNGRIVDCDELTITITEQDYICIQHCYDYEEMGIRNFIRYPKGYLPTDLVDAILILYERKTKLKGVANEEVNYVLSKEMINAVFGMCVTSVVRDIIMFYAEGIMKDGKTEFWDTDTSDMTKEINKYNASITRFLFYPWGVWCTAFARKNLWSGICEFKHDYIYSDTDSIKVRNIDKHMDYINTYNANALRKLERAMTFHGFSIERAQPMTIKGIKKPLGVWDFDGHYDKFKSLGAKRYMYCDNGKYHLTVAGLSKKDAMPWIVENFPNVGKKDPFEMFEEGLHIPCEATGKLTHTYIDEPMTGTITDYLGNTSTYYEQCGVHMEGATYDLSMSPDFVSFVRRIQTSVNTESEG